MPEVDVFTGRHGRRLMAVKAARFREELHPRDRLGRFIETGAEVRILGGGLAKVLANVGGGRIEVQTPDGSTRVVHRNYLTVVKRPDGSAPTKDPAKATPTPEAGIPTTPDAEHVPDVLPADNADEVRTGSDAVGDRLMANPDPRARALASRLSDTTDAYVSALLDGTPDNEADERAALMDALDDVDAADPSIADLTRTLREEAAREPDVPDADTGTEGTRQVPSSDGDPVDVTTGDSIAFTADGQDRTGKVVGFTANHGPLVETDDGTRYPLVPDAAAWQHTATDQSRAPSTPAPQQQDNRDATPSTPQTDASVDHAREALDKWVAATGEETRSSSGDAERTAAERAVEALSPEETDRLLSGDIHPRAAGLVREVSTPDTSTGQSTDRPDLTDAQVRAEAERRIAREDDQFPGASGTHEQRLRDMEAQVRADGVLGGPQPATAAAAGALDADQQHLVDMMAQGGNPYERGSGVEGSLGEHMDALTAAGYITWSDTAPAWPSLTDRGRAAANAPDAQASDGSRPDRVGTITLDAKPGGSGTVDDPIMVGGDIEYAARLLAQGKHVRLNQPYEVATLLDRLAEIARDSRDRGEDAPAFDLCKVSVAGTNLFCQGSRGVPRIEMPQLAGVPIPGSPADALPKNPRGRVDLKPGFRQMLDDAGIPVTDKTVAADHLRSTQGELGGAATTALMDRMRSGDFTPPRLFVTRDGYIIDGHHTWAAQVGLDVEDNQIGGRDMDVAEVDLDIGAALDLANEYARQQGLPQRGFNTPPSPTPAQPQPPPVVHDVIDEHLAQFIGPDGYLTPERQALHDKIVEDTLAGVPSRESPTLYFLGGGPAAGKSTMLESGGVGVPEKGQAVEINADEVKAALPEYQEGLRNGDPGAAGLVHEESAMIAARIRAEAQKRSMDIVLDGVGDSGPEKLRGKLQDAKDAGYKVNGLYATVPTEVALDRATARGKKTGRVVPPSVIVDAHAAVSAVLPQVLDEFDSLELFDTMEGARPIFRIRPDGSREILDYGAYAEFLRKAEDKERLARLVASWG